MKVITFVSENERDYRRLSMWANGESRVCGKRTRTGYIVSGDLEKNTICVFCILPFEATVDHKINHEEREGACKCTVSFLKPGWFFRVSNIGGKIKDHIVSFDGVNVLWVEEQKFDLPDLKRRATEFYKKTSRISVISPIAEEQASFASAQG